MSDTFIPDEQSRLKNRDKSPLPTGTICTFCSSGRLLSAHVYYSTVFLLLQAAIQPRRPLLAARLPEDDDEEREVRTRFDKGGVIV